MLSRTESLYFRPDNTLKKSITVKAFQRTERKVTHLLGNCYRNPLSLYNCTQSIYMTVSSSQLLKSQTVILDDKNRRESVVKHIFSELI